MSQLTKHFSAAEFACRDGCIVPPELGDNLLRLATQLEALRRFIKRPVVILSGYRTPAWNARVKGVASSRHLTAEAADIRVAGMAPGEVHAAIESLILRGRIEEGGLGLYPSWVHLDVRGKRARWG